MRHSCLLGAARRVESEDFGETWPRRPGGWQPCSACSWLELLFIIALDLSRTGKSSVTVRYVRTA